MEERIEIQLNGTHVFSGWFVSTVTRVNDKLSRYTKRELQRLCLVYWPELFRAELRARPAYILAVITSQL